MLLAASAVLSNPLVVRASSTVAKKAFDVVARNSLRGITDILSERFKGNAEVLKLRDELELKVNVLSLPVDICVQQALQGNSALQGALNVALKVLQDIEDFEANLQQQEIDLARGDSSGTPDKTTVSEAVKKLTHLIKQLDSLLPYLSVAINAVNLLNTGSAAPTISPSRLMGASWQIRSTPTTPGAPIMKIPQAVWHRQGLVATASGRTPMQTLFPLCSLTLRRPEEEEEVDSKAATVGRGLEYELCVQQDLDDGAYHEDEEEAGKQVLSMQDIVAVEWSTSHSLHLGSNDYSPALVIHALQPTPGLERKASSRSPSSSGTPQPAKSPQAQSTPHSSSSTNRSCRGRSRSWSASPSPAHMYTGPKQKYALQCYASEDKQQDAARSQQWNLLSQFEYVVRLCMLESREESPHHLVGTLSCTLWVCADSASAIDTLARADMLLQDERIQMAFNSQSPAPLAMTSSQHGAGSPRSSPDLSTVCRQPDTPPETPDMAVPRKDTSDMGSASAVSTLTKNLDNMAFGSPT